VKRRLVPTHISRGLVTRVQSRHSCAVSCGTKGRTRRQTRTHVSSSADRGVQPDASPSFDSSAPEAPVRRRSKILCARSTAQYLHLRSESPALVQDRWVPLAEVPPWLQHRRGTDAADAAMLNQTFYVHILCVLPPARRVTSAAGADRATTRHSRHRRRKAV